MRSGWRVTALVVCAAALQAQSLRPSRADDDGGTTMALRQRLHIDPLITPPGTMEFDFASQYSFSTWTYSAPSALKFTPKGPSVIWGRTEYSVSFDSFDVASANGRRQTQFSQAVTLTATSVVHDGEKLDFAIAPVATAFLRDETGVRLGAIGIARYDGGRNSLGTTVGWTWASHVTPTNPAGTLDLGVGYGRNLAGSDLMEKFTPHINAVWEKSTGHVGALSVFEGVEYQMTERLAFDLSMQHVAVTGGPTDHQLVFGVVATVGKMK